MIDWTKPLQVVRNKAPARVLCTDLKANKCPIVVAFCSEGTEYVTTLTLEGCVYPNVAERFVENVPQRHKHADVIIAWAKGVSVQFRCPTKGMKWSDLSPPNKDEFAPGFDYDCEYRVKPE